MGLFDGFFNFGNEYLSPGQPTGGGSFPLQDFRNDSFASMMNPMGNFMPNTKSFLDLLGEVPTREDHKLGLGRGIGAALAGLAASFNSPGAGAAVAGSIANAPYMNAMQDFQGKLGAARQGAQAEQGLANLSRQFSNDAFQRSQFAAEMGLKRDQLNQQGTLANRELGIKEKSLEQQIAQQALDRALQEKKITIDEYQAQTSRLNANANVGQSNAMAKYYEQMGNKADRTVPGTSTPSAALIESNLRNAIMSTPEFARPEFFYKDSEGKVKFNANKVLLDPVLGPKFRELIKKHGMPLAEEE